MGSIALSQRWDGPADPAAVHAMLAAAPHRGIRSEVATQGSTALGITTHDRTDAWLASDGTVMAAVAGAVDNLDELRRDLGLGATATPADVALSTLRRSDSGRLDRFRGSFAGAVSDGRTVQCFRDQFGSRPLYYRGDGNGMVAATECKQVNAGWHGRVEPDLDYVTRSFYGDVAADETVFVGVKRVERASVLTARAGEIGTRRYWDPTSLLETSTLNPDEILEATHCLLARAVDRVVTGDDVVLLSGGVDSPTIAALAAEAHLHRGGRRLTALSAVYPDQPSVDESPYIQSTAAHLDLDLHTFVTAATAYDDTEHWVDVLDGPVSTVAIPEVAEAYRRAKALGSGNVLTGELEEYVFEVSSYLLDHLVTHRRWTAVADHVRQLRAKGRKRRRIALSLAKPFLPTRLATAYVLRYRDCLPSVPSWIDRSRLDQMGLYADLARPAADRWGPSQTSPLLGHVNSFETDEICAAYCGVDVRRPFADIDLWSFALSLPAEQKWPELRTKALLRRVMRGEVPSDVLERTDKTYFDEAALAAVDYPALRKWIFQRGDRIDGVDYDTLYRRLDTEDLSFPEVQWATDLMYVHAFLDRWS